MYNILLFIIKATFGYGGSDGKVNICNLNGEITNSIDCGYVRINLLTSIKCTYTFSRQLLD